MTSEHDVEGLLDLRTHPTLTPTVSFFANLDRTTDVLHAQEVIRRYNFCRASSGLLCRLSPVASRLSPLFRPPWADLWASRAARASASPTWARWRMWEG